jgi:hypothetical protein
VFLLDTNIVSEIVKRAPDAEVLARRNSEPLGSLLYLTFSFSFSRPCQLRHSQKEVAYVLEAASGTRVGRRSNGARLPVNQRHPSAAAPQAVLRALPFCFLCALHFSVNSEH